MLLSQRLFYHVAAEFSDTFFKHLVKLVGGLFHKIEEANFTKIIGLIKSESGEASLENRYFLLKAAEIGKMMKLSAMSSLSDLVVVGWQQNSTLRCGKQYGKSLHSLANY